VAHSFVYRTSRSNVRAQQLEKELRGLVDECALCAGSLQLFLEAVAATVQRHNKAAYTHTGEASAAVLKRDQAKLRKDLAAAILELRQCFPDEMLRASGEMTRQAAVVIDDRDAIAVTKCWCAEATAIVNAVNTRCSGLQARIQSHKFGTGGYRWRNLSIIGCLCVAAVHVGWKFLLSDARGGPSGPGVRDQIAKGIASGREFFVLHLLTPLEHIRAELLLGAVRCRHPVTMSGIHLTALLRCNRAQARKSSPQLRL
jgi:hypothetical protein